MADCKQKYISVVYESKVKKQPKSADVKAVKAPRGVETESFYQKTPIWAFSKCDIEHEKWGLNANKSSLADVILRLRAFEGMKWADILSDKSGRKRPKNSEKEISVIIKDAQRRFESLNLQYEHDSIYSFTLDGAARLWGVRTENVFYVVWIDTNHEIYPVEKSHT